MKKKHPKLLKPKLLGRWATKKMSKPYLLDLTFKDIFAKAIREWPMSLAVGKVITYPHAPWVFTVPKIWDLCVAVQQKSLDDYYQMVLFCMHESINHEYYRLAREKSIIRRQDLNVILIKESFDGWMKRSRENRVGNGPTDLQPNSMSMILSYLKDPRNNVDLS